MKNRYKPFIILSFSLAIFHGAFAQRIIQGVVKDKYTGEPMVGVSVALMGSARGAVTNIEGQYNIEVPTESAQLLFSFFGYSEQRIEVKGMDYLAVSLIPIFDPTLLTSNGACVSVYSKPLNAATPVNFNQGNITNPIQLAQGKLAGLSITRPGSDPNQDFIVRVRGLSSLISETAPLIVLDGVPGVDLQLIDPNDVESITVLKDAASAAIYGMRGAAGVLLITSKKGAQKSTVTYTGQVCVDQARRYNLLNANELIAAGGRDLSPNEDIDTDWQNEVLQTGISTNHNLRLSGAVGKGTIRTSFNYRDVQGVLRKSGLQQYNGSVSFSQKALSDRLTIQANIYANVREANYSSLNAYQHAISTSPTMAVRSDAPEYAQYGGYVQQDLFIYLNPTAMIDQNKNDGKTTQVLGNVRADFEIIPGLTAGLQVAQALSNGNYGQYFSKESKATGINRNGYAVQSQQQSNNNSLQLTGNYVHQFNAFGVNILGGYAWQRYQQAGLQVEAGNILSDAFENYNLGAFLDITRGNASISGYSNQNTLIAFFGRAQVNFNNLYFLEAGLRREGSSRLSKNNKWGAFPFMSAGVDLSRFLTINNLQQLKLRVGYGISGQQPGQSALSSATFAQGTLFYYNGGFTPSYGLTRNENPNLKWEEKQELNIGLDFALHNGRITGSVDWFKQRTSDLIQQMTVAVPPNVSTSTYLNIAEITNNGLEISLNWEDLIKSKNFSWSMGAVLTANNLVLSNAGRNDTLPISSMPFPGACCATYNIIYSGSRLGEFWGPVRQGVDADGTVIYKDIDRNGQLDPYSYNRDQTYLGSGLPAFEFGWSSSLTLHHFDLNFLMRGAVGHDIAHENRALYENFDVFSNMWNKPVTKYIDKNVRSASNRFNSYFLEKGSFVRLDNCTLGYNVTLKPGAWFDKFRIYVGGQNLITLTKYTGLDSEVRYIDNYQANNPVSPGIDRNSTYPLARSIFLGVQVGL